MTSQQARDIFSRLVQCWASVSVGGPTLNQPWMVNVFDVRLPSSMENPLDSPADIPPARRYIFLVSPPPPLDDVPPPAEISVCNLHSRPICQNEAGLTGSSSLGGASCQCYNSIIYLSLALEVDSEMFPEKVDYVYVKRV